MRNKYLIIGLLLIASCTKESDVAKFANKEGWDSYRTTGYSFFGCDEKDQYHTAFIATKNNKQFSGVVCSGIFKGATLRLK